MKKYGYVMKYRINLSRKLDREIAHLKEQHDEITKREVEIVKSNNPEFAGELKQLVNQRIKIEYLLKTKYESVINRRYREEGGLRRSIELTKDDEQLGS